MPSVMFHDGNRRLQDQFDSRRISDRLEEKLTRQAFTDQDRAFIEKSMFFFLATADAEGRPDCSFKGGTPAAARERHGERQPRRCADAALCRRPAPGARVLVRVQARATFPNCPRYIVTPGADEPSRYAPWPDYQPLEPAWKGFDDFKDYIHPRQPTPRGEPD